MVAGKKLKFRFGPDLLLKFEERGIKRYEAIGKYSVGATKLDQQFGAGTGNFLLAKQLNDSRSILFLCLAVLPTCVAAFFLRLSEWVTLPYFGIVFFVAVFFQLRRQNWQAKIVRLKRSLRQDVRASKRRSQGSD
jgi:hypothetical protein